MPLTYTASAGTLVGAALESAGYYYQSVVLDQLVGPLQGFGYLIYIAVAILGITIYLLTSRPSMVLWLCVGPAIYFSAVFPRTQTPGVEWVYGMEKRNQAEVQRKVTEVLDRRDLENYTPRVSALFANYTDMLGYSVRQVVAAINTGRKNSDMMLFARAQLYGMTASHELTDPGLRQLIHYALLGECRATVEAGREAADDKNSPQLKCEHAKKYIQGARNERIAPDSQMLRYMAGVKVDCPAVFDIQVARTFNQEMTRLENAINDVIIGPKCALNVPPGGAATTGGPEAAVSAGKVCRDAKAVDEMSEADRATRDAAIKAAEIELSSRRFSCHDIWNIVYIGLHLDALGHNETVQKEFEKRGLDATDLVNLLSDMYVGKKQKSDNSEAPQPGQPTPSTSLPSATTMEHVTRAIALRSLKNEVGKGSNSSIITEYENRGRTIRGMQIDENADLTQREKDQVLNRRWSSRSTMVQVAYSLPYYQGMILYFLGMLFPFFALLLLIPGMHTGFINWFLLWFWAKSWDIGFAIVAILDDVLFSIFVTNLDGGKLAGQRELNPELATAILGLREADPTFDVSTYYHMMSVSVQSIPVISAMLILSSAQIVSSLVASGLKNVTSSGAFGGGGSLESAARNADVMNHLYQQRGAVHSQMISQTQKYLSGDTGITPQGAGADGQFRYDDMMSADEWANMGVQAAGYHGFVNGLAEGLGQGAVANRLLPGGGGKLALGIANGTNLTAGMSAAASRIPKNVHGGALSLSDARMQAMAKMAESDVLQTNGILRNANSTARGTFQVPWNPDKRVWERLFNEPIDRAGAAVDFATIPVDLVADMLGLGMNAKVVGAVPKPLAGRLRQSAGAAAANTAQGVGGIVAGTVLGEVLSNQVLGGSESVAKEGIKAVQDHATTGKSVDTNR